MKDVVCFAPNTGFYTWLSNNPFTTSTNYRFHHVIIPFSLFEQLALLFLLLQVSRTVHNLIGSSHDAVLVRILDSSWLYRRIGFFLTQFFKTVEERPSNTNRFKIRNVPEKNCKTFVCWACSEGKLPSAASSYGKRVDGARLHPQYI